MSALDKTTLKGYFNTGDIPTEAHFANLIDTIGGPTLTVAASDASDASKGRADYVCDGTNDEVEIQAALDALPAAGGCVRLTEGNFLIDSVTFYNNGHGDHHWHSLIIYDTHPPIKLTGAGGGATVIKLNDNQHDTTYMLQITGRDNDNHRTNPTTITDITWNINGSNQPEAHVGEYVPAIAINFAKSVWINKCRFLDALLTGVQFELLGRESVVSNCYFSGQGGLNINQYNIIAVNNIFEIDPTATTLACLNVTPDTDRDYPSGGTYKNYGCIVANNQFKGGFVQLIVSGARGTVVTGNVFSDKTGWSVYVKQSGLGDGGEYNIIEGNVFYNVTNAIRLYSGAQYNRVANNIILPGQDRTVNAGILEFTAGTGNNLIEGNIINASAPITRLADNGTIVRGNIGYVTENQGAAASVADGGTIAHGCATTPSVATVSGSVAGEIVTVTSIDATNITVAIKGNDGSAGTTQTVYWRAEV